MSCISKAKTWTFRVDLTRLTLVTRAAFSVQNLGVNGVTQVNLRRSRGES